MNKALDIAAKVLSVIFYPLFVPTYGIALFCYAHCLHIAPLNTVWMAVAMIGTLLLTCICPIASIWFMVKRGWVKDLMIDDPKERALPYLYAACSFSFWAYLITSVLHAPLFLSFISIGATVAIGLVALINRRWKISAHLTGMGGLVGGIFCYCFAIGAIPTTGTYMLWFTLSLLIMYARIRLNAHTPAQVCAGWLLGMCCTFIPYCIYTYAVY